MKKVKGKVLIIVDMQNDFIDGALANPDAQAIVDPLCEYIKTFDGTSIVCTRDTHYDNYMETQEGKNLPIPHCIKDTEGWYVNAKIQDTIRKTKIDFDNVNKRSFGYDDWGDWGFYFLKDPKEFVVVGTCTDICVVSNVLGLKAEFPEVPITVISSLCAGLTKENTKLH